MARLDKQSFPIAQAKPQSPVTESYRALRTNIQFTNISGATKVILITSALSGEGKTSTSVNLAVVSAQAGRKVLLMDADMRHPQVHSQLRLSNLIGLSNVLIKENDLENTIIRTDMPNLSVLTSGQIPPNPSEMLSSQQFIELVIQCRQTFDLVIIDSPPVLVVSDALIVAQVADGVVYVINAKQTNRLTARKAVGLIQQVNGRILGGVLNRVPKATARYAYAEEYVARPVKI